MLRYTLVALLALFIVAPAWGKTCTANATTQVVMTAQDQASLFDGQDDCTDLLVTDDLVIPAGAYFSIGGAISAASVSMDATATLNILPGAVLSLTGTGTSGVFHIEDGTVNIQGAVAYSGTIISLDYGAFAAGIAITVFPTPPAGLDGMYVRLPTMDSVTVPGAALKREVQIGEGPRDLPRNGCLTMSTLGI